MRCLSWREPGFPERPSSRFNELMFCAWAVLPGLMLLAVTGIIYVLFWNRDGTAAPESPAVPKAPMAMSSMPPPIVTNPVMYGPPPFEYAQYTQEVGPVMMTAQPPYQSAGIRMTAAGVPPAEPMMAAPMRPQSGPKATPKQFQGSPKFNPKWPKVIPKRT